MMPLREAATRLAETLEAENAALRRFDLRQATSMLSAKQGALAMFEQSSVSRGPADTSQPSMRMVAIRLRDASVENKRLLERAMKAQQHIMSLLAQAARKTGQSSGYGSRGAYVGGQSAAAFALSARA